MDAKQSMELALRIVESAAKRDVKDCKVSVYEKYESTLSWRDGRLDETKGSSELDVSVSLFRDGRVTNQVTGDLRERSLEDFMDEAVAFLNMIPPDPCQSLPDPKLQWKAECDFHVCDLSAYNTLDPEARRGTVRELYERIRRMDDAIVEASAWSHQNHDLNTLVYSTGFASQLERTWFDLGGSATMLTPDGTRPSSWYETSSRIAARLESPEAIALEAVQRCRMQFGQAKEASGSYDIVLWNECVPRMLYPLLNGISGWAIDQKKTIYDGKRGQLIASPLLTMRDDPLLSGGYNSRSNDRDGFASRRRDLVYRGVLQDYLVNWYYSRKLGLLPTTGSTSNVFIDPGTESLDKLVTGVEKGILVTDFNGGNDNPVTGDFSLGISGLLIEKGKTTRPVNEMLVSGNYRDFFNCIDAVGNDVCTRNDFSTPSLRFRAVKVAGR